MIIADNNSEDEPVSFLSLLWIEQNVNTVTNQSEVRVQLVKIKYEWEAQKLIAQMEENRLIPGLHYTPHKLDEMKQYSQYLNDKDDKPSRRD